MDTRNGMKHDSPDDEGRGTRNKEKNANVVCRVLLVYAKSVSASWTRSFRLAIIRRNGSLLDLLSPILTAFFHVAASKERRLLFPCFMEFAYHVRTLYILIPNTFAPLSIFTSVCRKGNDKVEDGRENLHMHACTVQGRAARCFH